MWRQVVIPLVKGQDEFSAELSVVDRPQDLLAARNVVYTTGSAVRGRPGLVTKDASTVVFDGVTAGGGSLSSITSAYAPKALHTVDAGNGAEMFLQCAGRVFKRSPGLAKWIDVGPAWSVRRTTWAAARLKDASSGSLGYLDLGSGGVGSVAITTPATGQTGFPLWAQDGSLVGAMAQMTNFSDSNTYVAASAAGNMVVWAGEGDGKVYAQILGTYPTAPQFTLATDATVNVSAPTTVQRVWAAYDGTNYYVAYITNTADPAPTTIKILKVNSSGTVTATLTYGPAGSQVFSLSVAADAASGKGLLAFTTSGAPRLNTRVFVTSTMTDSAINVNFTTTDTSNVVGAVAGIVGSFGYVACNGLPAGGSTSVDIWARSLTAASSIAVATYKGSSAGSPAANAFARQWQTRWQPVALDGHAILGIGCINLSVGGGAYQAPQWIALDVTVQSLSTAPRCPVPVAAGQLAGSFQVARACTAAVYGTGILIPVTEGVSFTQNDLESGQVCPVLLTSQGAPSARFDNSLLMGGNVGYTYDGQQCAETSWIESPLLGTAQGAGGALTALASYTLCAVWTFTDASGRTTRSNPSNVNTLTLTGANGTITATVTAPQVSVKAVNFGIPGADIAACRCELYMSAANPGSNAPLSLVATQTHSVTPGFPTMTFSVTANVTNGAKQLYTTGNVLNDDRAPSDRGLVTVGNRVWAADEHNLYPSHAASTVVGPAWDMEQLPIPVPSQYGRVIGLGGLDDKVVAVCESGVVTLDGPGFDEQGGGPGWSSPVRVYSVGGSGGPRGVCSFQDGVAWNGPDGLLYALSRGMAGSCVGRPTVTDASQNNDLTYLPPGVGYNDSVTNPCLVQANPNAATIRVLDLTNGQWNTWTGVQALSVCGTSEGLWAAFTGSPYVAAFQTTDGSDLGVAFAQYVKLSAQETAEDGKPLGWGRVRSVNPIFDPVGNHTLAVRATADDGRVEILNTSTPITTAAITGNWPFSRLPEHRTAVQRASQVHVELTATPALAEWTGVDLEVSGVPSRAPSRVRPTIPRTPPAWKALGTAAIDTGTGKSPAWPAGHVAGDYGLLISCSTTTTGGSNDTLTVAAGFTLVGGIESTSASGVTTHITVWWNFASSSSMPTPTVASSGLSGDSSWSVIATFSGAAAVAPENPVFSALGSGTAVSMTGSTTAGDSRLVIAMFTSFDSGIVSISGWANTDLTSVTEQVDVQHTLAGFGGQFQILGLATGLKAVTGSYGLTTATLSAFAGFGGWACAVMALKPG